MSEKSIWKTRPEDDYHFGHIIKILIHYINMTKKNIRECNLDKFMNITNIIKF